MTQFDFSHLYRTETVDVKAPDGKVLFTATVREITYGEKTSAQASMMASIDMPVGGSKASRQKQLEAQMKQAMKNGVSANISLYEEIAAIENWTLADAKGKPVPVCIEAWKALPVYFANQIVEVIERLNPEMDEDFPGERGSESTAE